jgi:hypothetical protein
MKKTIFICISLCLVSFLSNSQIVDIDFSLAEINKFSKGNNIEFSKIYKEEQRCLVVYKSGIILNLNVTKKENSEMVNHEMHFSYFLPKNIINFKNENDVIPLLKLINTQIKSNSFLLEYFVLTSIENALKSKIENIEKTEDGFKTYSTVKSHDCEVIFKIGNSVNGTNCAIDFYINL